MSHGHDSGDDPGEKAPHPDSASEGQWPNRAEYITITRVGSRWSGWNRLESLLAKSSLIFGRPLVILLLGMVFQGVVAGCARDTTMSPEVRAREEVVTVDFSGIGLESGRFHTYRSNSGKKADFFVYRESSWVPHTVLDAGARFF